MRARHGLVFVMACVSGLWICAAEDAKPPQAAKVIRFVAGEWDKTLWTPARMANQPQAVPFAQVDGGIGTTPQSFTRKDYAAETDNAILLHDLGATEAEFAV